jgi:hypothetical protein
MRLWIALFVAPILALIDLTVAFATVSWACAHQAWFMVHGVHLLFMAATAASAIAAGNVWWSGVRTAPDVHASGQVHFLAGIATASAALSTAAIAAMWMPTWMIPPCVS